jgi:hypothetical protein
MKLHHPSIHPSKAISHELECFLLFFTFHAYTNQYTNGDDGYDLHGYEAMYNQDLLDKQAKNHYGFAAK